MATFVGLMRRESFREILTPDRDDYVFDLAGGTI
jgi:hypothetical protein